uniref:Uncharacterized protein n=1 Tax=Panthera leo TaxID=9689 RepID=A0A8C8XWW2_PANLE
LLRQRDSVSEGGAERETRTKDPKQRKFVYCSDLLKLKIYHQITQENPGSRNT